ncbi:MAG TPA: hypothetical protein VGC29_10325 [Flavisolibacter sp.]
MQLRVACSLRYIQADEDIYDYKFGGFHFIKGSSDYALDSNIFTEHLLRQAGEIPLREFCNYPFIYGIFDLEEGEDLFRFIHSCHSRLHQFINCLWFVKNCSVNVGYCYTFSPDNKHVLCNTKQASFSNYNGGTEEVQIFKKDLEYAENIYNKMLGMASDDSKIELPKIEYDFTKPRPVTSDGPYHYKDYNKNNRIERAFSFLTMARTNSFLPLKIALTMSLLECLFTTDRQEVTHKVCERVAVYVGGSFEEKIANYKTIKEAYDIRSGFFHGQDIDKKKDNRINLQKSSKNVDDLLRLVMNKVILEDSKVFNNSDENRKNYFFKMIFNSSAS